MGIYMMTVKQRLLLQECRNIFYYETQNGEPDSADWQDNCDALRSSLSGQLAIHMANAWSFYSIEYRRVDLVGLPSFEVFPTAGALVGGGGTDPLPTQVAMLVTVKAATQTPNKGRTYLPGFNEDSLDVGLFGTLELSQAAVHIEQISAMNAGGPAGLHRVAAQWNSTHTQVIATNDLFLLSAVANPIPATQRRRRIGVGI